MQTAISVVYMNTTENFKSSSDFLQYPVYTRARAFCNSRHDINCREPPFGFFLIPNNSHLTVIIESNGYFGHKRILFVLLCHWSLPGNLFFKLTHNIKLTFSMESPQTGIAKLQQTHDISKHSVPRGFSTKSQAQNPLEKSIFATWHNQN